MRFRDANEFSGRWIRQSSASYAVLISVGNVPNCCRSFNNSSMSPTADIQHPRTTAQHGAPFLGRGQN